MSAIPTKTEIDSETLSAMKKYQPVFWHNAVQSPVFPVGYGIEDILDAETRLKRFAPFLKRAFPETDPLNGIIESGLIEIPRMKQALIAQTGASLGDSDRLLLKRDDALPISGSIKARGGIYEVLKLAEKLALEDGSITTASDYTIFSTDSLQRLLSKTTLIAGSTGNLGLSIGIIGRSLGFSVEVHMSADARSWKKERLRSIGARVIEYPGDFSTAVAGGRTRAAQLSASHFVDDESSEDLFFGYAVAALRLKDQLFSMGIPVDDAHPLAVYLPCGVGGGPGGILFGLKQLFGSAVHCFTAEPTHAPSMLLGLMSGLHERISVYDIGLDGKTTADGLAVCRPSGLVSRMIRGLVNGCFTVSDDDLFTYLRLLNQRETIQVEPSACAGFGAFRFPREVLAGSGFNEKRAITHVVWATGGKMVPAEEMLRYLRRGNFPVV